MFLKRKEKNKQLILLYVFESFKLLVVVGQRVSLFTVHDLKKKKELLLSRLCFW